MLAEIRTGLITSSDGAVNPARSTKEGGLVIAPAGTDYQELAARAQIFQAASQAATTTSAALTTTHLGVCINNPAGNNKLLIMLHFGFAVIGAPAALSAIGLQAGYSSAGVVTHTTPLVPLSTYVNQSTATGTAKADAACTTVGTPVIVQILGTVPITGATAQVVNPPTTGLYVDLKGAIVIPPGGWIASYTSTALSGIASFMWAEVTL